MNPYWVKSRSRDMAHLAVDCSPVPWAYWLQSACGIRVHDAEAVYSGRGCATCKRVAARWSKGPTR